MLKALLGTIAEWFTIPKQVDHAIWGFRMKRRLRDLAERLEAFRDERAAVRPRSPTETAEPPYLAAVQDWAADTTRLFQDRYWVQLRQLQDDLDAREISNSQLWEKRELSPIRLQPIIDRLWKLEKRNRLLR